MGKRKKLKKELKQQYKFLVTNDLLPLLEKIDERTLAEYNIEKVHVWVDQRPSSQVHYDESDDSEMTFKSKKKKVSSRQQTIDDSPSVKKAHPRSNESYGKDEEIEDEPLLCRNFFFTGDCDGFKNGGKLKKNSYQCDLVHCTRHRSTLFSVLNCRSSKKGFSQSVVALDYENAQRNVLQKASNAAAVAQMKLEEIEEDQIVANDDTVAIDMLYHLEYDVLPTELNLSRMITSVLSREKVPVGSIGYLVLNNELIFDRYDGGNIMSKDLQSKILKEEGNESAEESNEGACNDIVNLPSAVLEMIITFLPDHYSGIMPAICKVWYQEIGCNSPALWRNLNERNKWPNPHTENLKGNVSDSVVHAFKDMFISNYQASLRITNLLEEDNTERASNAVAVGSIPVTETESFIDFRFFSESSVLIRTEDACIYMMQVYKEKDNLISKTIFGPIKIVPKPHSKKSYCKLMNFEIDEQYVLFSFAVDLDEGILTSISKDNLLKYSSESIIECGDDDVLRYHDLSNGFREFYQNCNDEEFDFIRDFIDENTRLQIHARLVDHNVALCGYGIFVACVEIYTREDDIDDEINVHGMGLISCSINSKSTFVIDFLFMDRIEESIYGLASNYHVKRKSDRTIIIDKEIGQYYFIDRKGLFDRSLSKERTLSTSGHHLLLTSNFGVSANLADSEPSNFSYNIAITLDLLESERGIENDGIKTVYLPKSYSAIVDMIFLGINHILLVCKNDHPEEEYRIDEGFDGHWFGIDNVGNYDFIVLQIPTLIVVHVQTVHLCKECLFLLQAIPKLGTIAMMSHGSFRITGINESSLMLKNGKNEKNLSKTKKEKKKKKRLASKTEKKDGFARGMNFW